MRITCFQLDMTDRPRQAAIDDVLTRLDQAAGSDLILLPEIWPTGYFAFAHYARDAEPVDGPLVTTLREKARALSAYIFSGSFIEKQDDQLFNTSVLINDQGDVLGQYRKIHLFGYDSDEQRLLTRGQAPTVLQTPWGNMGISTCYDLRFPELFRAMTDLGAQFFLVASAWPEVRLNAWRLFNQARAHENLAFLISCNCAGQNQGKSYAGHSMIVDPMGAIVAEAGRNGQLLSAEIDPDQVVQARKSFPALADRILGRD